MKVNIKESVDIKKKKEEKKATIRMHLVLHTHIDEFVDVGVSSVMNISQKKRKKDVKCFAITQQIY